MARRGGAEFARLYVYVPAWLRKSGGTMKALRQVISVVSVAVGLCGSAQAGVLWDSGPPIDEGVACNGDACGFLTEWELLDDFVAPEDWRLTGLTFFGGWYDPDPTDTYISTTWRIVSGTPGAFTTLFTGTAVATLTDLNVTLANASASIWRYDVSGLNIDLAAGTYYLGHHHDFTDDTWSSTGARTTGTGIYEQYDGPSYFGNFPGVLV